jgi:hypothetical protein
MPPPLGFTRPVAYGLFIICVGGMIGGYQSMTRSDNVSVSASALLFLAIVIAGPKFPSEIF